MAAIVMRKIRGVLKPVDEMAKDELSRVPNDKDVLVTVKSPRNIKQHRLFWALATKLADACDYLHDREDAADYLKLRARHFKIVTNPRNGMTYLVPKSIAFASLDQEAFSRLLSRMIYVACHEIIPGLPESDLRAEIEAMVSDTDRRAA